MLPSLSKRRIGDDAHSMAPVGNALPEVLPATRSAPDGCRPIIHGICKSF